MSKTYQDVSKEELEKVVQQLYLQLEELRTAIKALQDRSLLISNEISEVRMAYETLTNIQQLNQSDVMASLDRYGYVYVRVHLENTDRAVVRIGRDLYAVVPIDVAKNILMNFEKDLTDELRKIEADLKQLTSIYTQLQNKLQEHLSALIKKEEAGG